MLLQNLAPLKSSWIVAAGWSNGRMAIRFRSGRLRFYRCDVRVWQNLMSAPSAGRFFNKEIKGKLKRCGADLDRGVEVATSRPVLTLRGNSIVPDTEPSPQKAIQEYAYDQR